MLRIQLIGNLGQDATVRVIDSGASAISFSVAITEKFTQQNGDVKETTYWVNCTLWKTKQQSVAIADYLKKGTKVFIEGKPSTKHYVSRDGETKTSLEVRVERVELLSQSSTSSSASHAPVPTGVNDDLPF